MRISSTCTLNDYPRLPISIYSQQLKQDINEVAALEVHYQHRGKAYHYDLPLTTTQPTYGGLRYWWQCIKCQRRVAVLYCAGLYVCRHCIGAKYHTQHMQPIDRHFKRIAELRARLGWHGGLAHGIGGKPKGMHQKTFDKLWLEYHHVARKVLNMTMAQLQKGITDDEI